MSPENFSPTHSSTEALESFELNEQQIRQLEESFTQYTHRAESSGLPVGTYAYEYVQGFKNIIESGAFAIKDTPEESKVVVRDGHGEYSIRNLLPREFRDTEVVDEIEKSILADDKETLRKVDALLGVIASESERVLKANLGGGDSDVGGAESELITADQIPASPEDNSAGEVEVTSEEQKAIERELEEIHKQIEDDPQLRRLSLLDKQYNKAKADRGRVYAQQQRGEISDRETEELKLPFKERMDDAFNEMRRLPKADQDRYHELLSRRRKLIAKRSN